MKQCCLVYTIKMYSEVRKVIKTLQICYPIHTYTHFFSLHYHTICIQCRRKVCSTLNMNSIFFKVCNTIHNYFHIYIRNGTRKQQNSIKRDTIICTSTLGKFMRALSVSRILFGFTTKILSLHKHVNGIYLYIKKVQNTSFFVLEI